LIGIYFNFLQQFKHFVLNSILFFVQAIGRGDPDTPVLTRPDQLSDESTAAELPCSATEQPGQFSDFNNIF